MFTKYKQKEKIDPEKLAICGHCKHEFFKANMRRCPHPLVQQLCGEWICYHCCMRCDFGEKAIGIGGIRCTFKGA